MKEENDLKVLHDSVSKNRVPFDLKRKRKILVRKRRKNNTCYIYLGNPGLFNHRQCYAWEVNGLREMDDVCTLGYKMKNGIPLEKCPKPKTYNEFYELYNKRRNKDD